MTSSKPTIFKRKKQTNGKNNSRRTFDILPSFLKNKTFRIWLNIVAAGLILAFILSPQTLYLSTPHIRVGFIASKDIKADRDFLVEDRASTEQKRAEALNQVQPVYDYDGDMPARIGIDLSKAFREAENAYLLSEETKESRDELRAKARKDFEETLGITLRNGEYKILDKEKFDFRICNDVMRLVYAVYNSGFISNRAFSNTEREKGIIIRDIRTQVEKEKRNLSSAITTDNIDSLILETSKTELADTKKEIRDLCRDLAKKLISPNLTFANNASEKRKQDVLESVKPVFFKVQKNEIIVRAGEKITPVALDKINTLFKGREGTTLSNVSVFAGMFFMIILLTVILYRMASSWLYSKKDAYHDILFLSIVAILQVLLVKAGIFIAESLAFTFSMIPSHVCFYAIPFTMGAMLVSVLMSRNGGIILSMLLSFLVTFLFEERLPIFLFSFVGSIVAAHRIFHCTQRSAFIRTGILVGAMNTLVIVCLSLIAGTFMSLETPLSLLMGFTGGVLSGLIVSAIVPLFESLFGYTTDIRLLELANLNQPMFQKMIMVAPGTYHHSVVVASMAEAAAEVIEANSLLTRVSAFYHDIGKIRKPQYYIENQRKWENKHDALSPEMSKLIIISHVKDGYDMAKELRLGKSITDIIRQHHGTRLVRYFYDKARKESAINGKTVLESDFRYPGPKPQTKEAAIVLLADIIEASARTLNEPTPSRITNLVDRMIKEIMTEGQLDESELTFRDLDKIADSFTRILTGIFHHRIEYDDSPVKDINGPKETDDDSHTKSAEQNKDRRKKGTAVAP